MATRSVSPMARGAAAGMAAVGCTGASWVASTPGPPMAMAVLSPTGTMSPMVQRGNVGSSVAPVLVPCWQFAAVPPANVGSASTSSVGGQRAPSEPAACSARGAWTTRGTRRNPAPELIGTAPRSFSPMPRLQSIAMLPPVPVQWQHQAPADSEASLPDPDASRADLMVSPAASDIQVDVATYVSSALRGQAVRQLLSCLRVATHRSVSCALGRWWRATASAELGGSTTAGVLARLATYDRAWHHRDHLHSVLASAVAAEGRKVAHHERTLSMLLGLRQLHSCLHMWDHIVLRSALRQLRNHTLEAAPQCGASGAPPSSSTDTPSPVALPQALPPAPPVLSQPTSQIFLHTPPPQHPGYFEGSPSSAAQLGYSLVGSGTTGGVLMAQAAAEGGARRPPSPRGPARSPMRRSLPPTSSRASLARLLEKSGDQRSLPRRASAPRVAPSRRQEPSDMSASSTTRLSTACLTSALSSQILSAAPPSQGTEALAFKGPGNLSETTSSWDSAQTIPNIGMNLAKPPFAELTALNEVAPSGLSMKIAAASPMAPTAAYADAAAAAGAAAAQSASSAQAPYGSVLDSALESTPPGPIGTAPPLLGGAGHQELEADASCTGADQHDESETPTADLSTDGLGSMSQRLNVSLRQVSQRKTAAAMALGVRKDASRNTIQHAFRQQSLNFHPDKGGQAADFQVLSEARRKMAGS